MSFVYRTFRVDFKVHRIHGSLEDMYLIVGAPDKDAATALVLARTPYPITITRSIPVEDEFFGAGLAPFFGAGGFPFYGFPFYGFDPRFYASRGPLRYF